MTTQSKPTIDYAKLNTAKAKLGDVMKTANDALIKLSAQGPITSASPEDVAKALTEAAVPAIEETLAVISDVVEALPVEEGLGEEEENPLEGTNENIGEQNGGGDDPRIRDLEEKTASLLKENIQMKKASLAKRLASVYPSNMRQAAEDEFLKENEEEDDLDILEAKVASAERVVRGYHDANMINKAKTTQYQQHTAKINLGSKMHTASAGAGLDWRLRV